MFERLKRTVDRINQTLVEGNYRVPPMTFGRLVRGLKPELPATSEVAVGTTMIEQGKSLGSKFMWGSAIAFASMSALMWGAIGMGVLGIGVYTLEYFRAKKAREDDIVEINFAGQRVKGQRSDMYRLHHAQLKIMNVSASLEGANAETAGEAIHDILATVKHERARVEVLDSGRYGAGKESYAFSEPGFRLLFPETRPAELLPASGENAQALPSLSLRNAWDSKRCTADQFVDRLAELQEALPADMAEKLKTRLTAGPAKPQPQP